MQSWLWNIINQSPPIPRSVLIPSSIENWVTKEIFINHDMAVWHEVCLWRVLIQLMFSKNILYILLKSFYGLMKGMSWEIYKFL